MILLRRILGIFVLAISILFLPFSVSVLLAFLGMIYFDIFLEATLLFLLSDLLYGEKVAKLGGMVFISFIISLVALVIIEIIKKKMNFYKDN